MDIIIAFILGFLQGLTEFIPISSSAHLVLVPWLFGWPSFGLLFDTMLHWGTLLAVLIYFRRDWVVMIKGFSASLTLRGPWNARPGGRLAAPESRLAWGLIIGTIPAAVLAYLFKDFFESLFATPRAVAAFLLVTAAILYASERLGRRARGLASLHLPDALVVGLAQAAAVAPGISRSGATIAAGLARGLTREAAARFSFLLSLPIIFGAGLLQVVDVATTTEVAPPPGVILAGFAAAAVTGYLCIRFLLNYLRRGSLTVFAIYCAVAGSAALLLTFVR